MPIIYSTEKLQEMHARLVGEYPGTDVVILKNGPMTYAFNASARAIYRVVYGQRPRDKIVLAADNVQAVVDKLMGAGLTCGVCDLDAERPNEYLGRSSYAPRID